MLYTTELGLLRKLAIAGGPGIPGAVAMVMPALWFWPRCSGLIVTVFKN